MSFPSIICVWIFLLLITSHFFYLSITHLSSEPIIFINSSTFYRMNLNFLFFNILLYEFGPLVVSCQRIRRRHCFKKWKWKRDDGSNHPPLLRCWTRSAPRTEESHRDPYQQTYVSVSWRTHLRMSGRKRQGQSDSGRVVPLTRLNWCTYCRCLRKHFKCHFLQIELNNWLLHMLQQSIKVSLIVVRTE
jgi:hypothetical protein